MSVEDRVRYGAAIGILLLWAGVVIFGDTTTKNAVTPAAIGAATFLFTSPLISRVRGNGKDKDDE